MDICIEQLSLHLRVAAEAGKRSGTKLREEDAIGEQQLSRGAAAEADRVGEQQLRQKRSGSTSAAEEGAIGMQQLHEPHTERGVFIHWTGGLDWTGLDWTGLEWTGLTQKSVKCLLQCRTEAKHTYSFTKVACIACFRVFLRVGRGQRSRAYLISFNEKIRRAFVYCRNRTPAFC